MHTTKMGTYEIKNFKSLETQDGQAWNCTLYRDGKKIGTAEQGGHGGPDRFWFDDRNEEAKFIAASREWIRSEGRKTGGYGDPEEFIQHLIDQFEYQKVAKRNAKKGCPFTAFLFGEPVYLLPESKANKKADYYNKSWTLPLKERNEEVIAAAMERTKAEKVIVIEAR